MTKILKTNVPATLQLDSWWLDHDFRPFPKTVIVARVSAKGATA